MGDFYRMHETPLDKAVNRALAEENERFLADPAAQHRAEQAGERWRALTEAEQTAGAYGVVLPIGLAQAILATLEGKPYLLNDVDPDLPAKMLRSRMERAAQR